MITLTLSLSVAAILTVVSTSLAKDAGPLKLNVESACRAAAKAVSASIGTTSDMFAPCMDDEKAALEQLKKNWATYPASDKAECIQPNDYVPGYVEWLTCLEMDAAVRVSRKGQPLITSSDPHGCPIVQFKQNGTISSVNTRC
jgi:hypothetical protein